MRRSMTIGTVRGRGGPASRDAFSIVLACSACAVGLGIALLFLMIAAFALPLFASPPGTGPFSWTWAPSRGMFGILPMIAGSLAIGASSVFIGWLPSLALCCWLLCPETGDCAAVRAARVMTGGLVRVMTAVPTVVYGFAAVFLLVPFLRGSLGGTGFSWLAAAVMLGLLILPTVVLVLQAGLRPRLEEAALPCAALGMTRLEALWHVVLPRSGRVLLASLVLGFGRAVGDTMLPLMLAGNVADVPSGLLSGLRTLTAHMALVTSNEVGSSAYDSLFMAGLLLLLVNGAASLALRRLAGRGATS